MTTNTFASVACAALASVALSTGTHAEAIIPGSLLVFPEFDSNARSSVTVFTVTNTSNDQVNGKVNVEFVYINGTNCQEFNRTRTLTPNDEITVVAQEDNPNQHKGYLYVFAKSLTTGAAIKFDHLIGSELVLAGITEADYMLVPWTFLAGSALAEGAATDLNGNGLRDLNGLEYEQSPATLLVPRFLGVSASPLSSVREELVLINLTGGAAFTAVVDFLVYNNNEEVFSAQYSFHCWAKVPLHDISSVFDTEFLLSTNHANEGPTVFGTQQTGWYRIDGNTAFSTAVQFSDPAILAAQIESIQITRGGAILPYAEGTQANGSLLSHNLFGN